MQKSPRLLLCLITSLSLTAIALTAEPPVVNPGPPPSDAIVLFNGSNLDQWTNEQGGQPAWKIENGTMTVNATGSLVTKEKFGDCQLHVEWASPEKVENEGQSRGNSGVYLQGRYEIQVLDSYQNPTYHDGQAGAFYGNQPPLVNASRKPGQWQSYDIIFHAPKTNANGQNTPGSFTVLHNGILVQDHTPIAGKATTAAKFEGITEKAPLVLQDHGCPVRYRNIWIRPLN